MALSVSILRDADGCDCTNGGVTSAKRGAKSVILLGVDGPRSESDNPNEVCLTLVRRMIGGREYIHAVPAGISKHTMFGGNFIFTSDSRFTSISPYPIAVHDRVE